MINAVNTLQTNAQAVQAASLSQPVQQVESAPQPQSRGYTALTIRVDVLNDIAILEAKSESGEILRQYPTESQIASFKRAAALEARREAESPLVQSQPQVSETRVEPQQSSAPIVQTVQPQQSAPVNSSAGVNVNQGTATLSDTSSAGSTQSITV